MVYPLTGISLLHPRLLVWLCVTSTIYCNGKLVKSEVWKFDAGAIGLTSDRQSGLVWRCMMLRPFPLSSKRLALVKRLTKPLIQLSNYQKATNRSTLATVFLRRSIRKIMENIRQLAPDFQRASGTAIAQWTMTLNTLMTHALAWTTNASRKNSTEFDTSFAKPFLLLLLTLIRWSWPKETTKIATNRWPMALFQQHWIVQKGSDIMYKCKVLFGSKRLDVTLYATPEMCLVTYTSRCYQRFHCVIPSLQQIVQTCVTSCFRMLQMFASFVQIDTSPRSNQCTASAHIQRNPHDSFLRLRRVTEHLRSQSSMKHCL